MPAPKAIVVEAGPYTEMFDSPDPTAAQPTRACLLQNCYPLEAEEGEGLVGRPGFTQWGARATAGSVVVQGYHQYTKLDGTEFSIRVAGGYVEFYPIVTTSAGNFIVFSPGFLTGNGITLSATARVSMVTFANKVIFSDGINKPWYFDGLIVGLLTNAPVFYGPMTVYSAKLFGIKASDRATFVWSEENDPTLGYQATVAGFTYANAWTIGQTDQNALVALRGTNAALYYWRERSTGAVYGKVNSTFVTTATHDAMSTSVGTKSPWGIVTHGEGFLFPDADGKPHRLIPGGGIVPVWQPFRETLATIPRANLVDALAIDYPAARLLLIGYTETLQTYPSAWLAYRDTPDGFKAAGIFRGFTATAAGVLKDEFTGVPVWVHGSSDGYTYKHGNPDGSTWDDVFASGTVAIAHIVQATPMAADPPRDAQFQRADLFTRAETVQTTTLDYETPRGRSTALAVTITPVGLINQYWDVATWDVDQWSAGAVEVHTAAGWNGVGRWIKPRLQHAVVGQRFGFIKWRVRGVPSGDSPSTP